MSSYFDYPFHIDSRGRAGTTERDDHIRDMIYQVLFTNPGERVNRPDFGCGLMQLVFMPNSDALTISTQFLVLGGLQRWLLDVIQVETVKVRNEDGRLEIEVVYFRRDTGQQREDRFVAPVSLD